ncbi:MAG: DUF4197 domain-containing protein [Rhodoferax sp.]|nr:DUF4197 domain-containing protein [Rhodoferax sp.]
MDRREFNSFSIAVAGLVTTLTCHQASALTLKDLSTTDAAKGLRTALEKGASAAIVQLGAVDGFLGNEKVRIAMPSYLEDVATLLRTLGQGARVDELVTSMNRGAEAAVPMASSVLNRAIQEMTVQDAKGILSGGDTAVSHFFAQRTRAPLVTKFLPIVTRATAKVGMVDHYNRLAGHAHEIGLMKKEDANIQQYVTAKTLDALFFMISEEEKKIRQNPMAYSSRILTKVFGALQ